MEATQGDGPLNISEEEEFEFRLRLEQEQSQQQPSFGQTLGKVAKDVFREPVSYAKDLATNPVSMAKALPAVLGTAGAVSPVPGGATLGTVGGRQMSNAALRLLGKHEEIPSGGSQMLEAGLSLLGDVALIPGVKGAIFGKQIGRAEKAKGVITRAPDKLPTAGTVGETLNTLEAQLTNGTISDPQTARDAYAITKYINSNPLLVGKSDEILVQAARVGKLAQKTLNRLIPDRLGPAEAMKKAKAIPNLLGRGWKAIPPWAQRGLIGGGSAALGFEGTKKLIGGGQ